MQTNEIIKVEHLVIDFGGFKAVNDISFTVNRGEIFGFLGANGAGKTTTIRTLCGLLNPSSGKVYVDGKDVSASTEVLKKNIGYMSQKFTLYPDLTVMENMEFAGSLYRMGSSAVQKRSKELFSFIGLEKIPSGPVRDLSGGTRQILSLAAALIHDPELIFLDEPTAGTSPKTRLDFWNLIKRLAEQDKTIFVTTHYMDEAENCGRIVLMERGRIVAMDSPDGLKKRYFPEPIIEISFLRENLQQKIHDEIKAKGLGTPSIFGSGLRIISSNKEELQNWLAERQDILKYKAVPPSLEDVFLKAISHAEHHN